MKNWMFYQDSEYRFHPSYGWVKRELNEFKLSYKIDLN